MKNLLSKQFLNEFVTRFPGDASGDIRPRQTPGMLYSKVFPTPVKNPKLLAWSEDLANELGLQRPQAIKEIDILAGNSLSAEMQPYAACYGGHQFGNWAGQLGDGRAITLGEWEAPDKKIWELQLKGAGLTPYSRRADGRAVLRSSVREYLMSEAMHYLGVPTTRALSLVSTGEQVIRDMFYDGNPEPEPGAIVMRVAPTFIRFGNFEILAARGELDNLSALIDWTISRYYPHLANEEGRIVLWYREVMNRTAYMVSEWMRVGFVHGVMNTDNMSILGLTIDYGPYSFVDNYDPNFTPNTTDLPGRRYAFGKQPVVAKWNLACLAGAIAPLLTDTTPLTEALEAYDNIYREAYYIMMAKKLGLDSVGNEEIALINRFENLLKNISPDMTLFFQQLATLPAEGDDAAIVAHFNEAFYKTPDAKTARTLGFAINAYQKRLQTNSISREERKQQMAMSNPRFILRNYLLHQAIEELENGNDGLFTKLQQAIKEPYSTKYDDLVGKRPDWANQKAGCSMLSCSS